MFQNYSENNDPSCGRRNIAALRREMMKKEITGFIIPRVDAHMGENVAPAAERLKWLTGFGGSWGVAIVKMDRAAIFVDGRYNSFELALISKQNISEYIHLLQSETLTQVSFKELVQLYSTRAGKSSGNLLEKSSLKKSNINH